MTTTNEIADKIASEQTLTKAKGESDRRNRLRFDHDGSHVWSGNIHSRIWQFQDKNTPEREARNPATGATIKVAEEADIPAYQSIERCAEQVSRNTSRARQVQRSSSIKMRNCIRCSPGSTGSNRASPFRYGKRLRRWRSLVMSINPGSGGTR